MINVNKNDNKTKYDNLTMEEIIDRFKTYGDRPVIHNGHIVGFSHE